MKVRQALILATQNLASHRDIENPSFESEVLLRYVLQINRAQLFLEKENELSLKKEQLYCHWLERRLQGEPVAYITRQREFYGLDFYVDHRVLIPRPETELLVEEALNFANNSFVYTIADIGTGSGAIAISLAVNLLVPSSEAQQTPQALSQLPSLRAPETPEAIYSSRHCERSEPISIPGSINNHVKIYATDISHSALEVAHLNCEKHHITNRITLLQGDLLDPLPEPVDILIANLPYVSKPDLALMQSAQYEPPLALDGGENGLDQIFRLCRQIKGKVNSGGCVLLEIGMGQGVAVKDYLQTLFKEIQIEIIPDLADIDRVVKMALGKH